MRRGVTSATPFLFLVAAVLPWACGGTSGPSSPGTSCPSAYMTCDSSTRSVTIKLTARGFEFDGYANGKMTMSVPQGWKVTVQFTNQAPTPHSAAIVSGPNATTPAFSGAGTPDPVSGTAAGQSATFTFTPDKTGSYRIACLVPGHEASGMWDTFQVTSGGSPSVSTS